MTETNARWDAEAVLAANTDWAWVPDEARQVRTPEYLVIAYADYVPTHTGARVFGSHRDPAGLVDEVHEVARGLGRSRLWWTVSDLGTPAGLEEEVMRRGGQVLVRMDVLALPLTDGPPDLGVSGDVEVERVTDERTLLDALTVEAAAFDWPGPTDEQVAAGLAEISAGRDDDSVGRFVARVDGRPASAGGWGLAGDVCRLWGAGTHPDLRGRGAYRAVLAERLRVTTGRGATLALTHGRVDTSSPILQRVGFTRYGEQRQIVVDL